MSGAEGACFSCGTRSDSPITVYANQDRNPRFSVAGHLCPHCNTVWVGVPSRDKRNTLSTIAALLTDWPEDLS